jgi:hypothetical protein
LVPGQSLRNAHDAGGAYTYDDNRASLGVGGRYLFSTAGDRIFTLEILLKV